MGATDIAAAMVTGQTWLKVPATVWIECRGIPSPYASAKDVVLYTLQKFGMTPFLYKSVEWTGAWCDTLGRSAASTVASMAVEMGAKCTFLPPGTDRPELQPITVGGHGAHEHLVLDLDGLEPMVAKPHAPDNVVPLSTCAGTRVDYVFIGSCTNSSIDDLAVATEVFSRHPVKPGVHCIVTPGSKAIYLEALRRGYIHTLVEAGAVISPPGCGSCIGTQGSVPASGETVVSTMNRNFQGRMGNADANIYLTSPLVAAHAATQGALPGLDGLTPPGVL